MFIPSQSMKSAANISGLQMKSSPSECPVCKDLVRVLEMQIAEYKTALCSPYYLVSTEVAAKSEVDMERAKSALGEHRLYYHPNDLLGDFSPEVTDLLLNGRPPTSLGSLISIGQECA